MVGIFGILLRFLFLERGAERYGINSLLCICYRNFCTYMIQPNRDATDGPLWPLSMLGFGCRYICIIRTFRGPYAQRARCSKSDVCMSCCPVGGKGAVANGDLISV